MASLTIGSGSAAAVLLTDRQSSRTGNRLLAASGRAYTAGHALCTSGRDEAVASGMHPLMQTDAEQLMHDGTLPGPKPTKSCWRSAAGRAMTSATRRCPARSCRASQVSARISAINPACDFATYQTLGNTGSVALPITMGTGHPGRAFWCRMIKWRSWDRLGHKHLDAGRRLAGSALRPNTDKRPRKRRTPLFCALDGLARYSGRMARRTISRSK